jgi:zinc protease
MRLATTPETWREALGVAERELRRALAHGFGETEVKEMIAIIRSQIEAEAAGASTRRTPAVAEDLLDDITDQEVFTTPATDLALFDALTRDLRPEDLDRALRSVWENRAPQIFVAGPMQLADPPAEILSVYENSRAVAVAAPAREATTAFAYERFGESTGVASRKSIADLDITRVAFKNGVVLVFKPTPFKAGMVHVAVRFGTGRVGMPEDRPGLDLLAGWGFVQGGLTRQGFAEIERIFAARQVGADLDVGESALLLDGQTTPEDLPAQLDLLAAYVSDPGYRPEAIERYRRRLEATDTRIAALPDGAVAGPVMRLVHGGDSRFALPPEGQARLRTMAELRAWLEPMLKQGPLQVAVVGDVDPDHLVAEVGRTFGALPARGEVPPLPVAPTLSMPAAAEPVRFVHGGTDGQGRALAFWPTTGWRDQETAIGLDLVADILADRLREEVRNREGAAYAPEADSEMSRVLPGFGHIQAGIDVAAAEAPRVVGLMREVAAAMREGGITQDEFERVLQPRLANARQARTSNPYWLRRVLVGMERYPEVLDEARNLVRDHETQTRDEVQVLAARYLDPARMLPVVVVPGDAVPK